MTRDDIIKMAQEACDPDIIAPAWDNGFWTLLPDELERFAALVAAAEREACHQLVWNTKQNDDIYVSLRETIAIAIKARGKK